MKSNRRNPTGHTVEETFVRVLRRGLHSIGQWEPLAVIDGDPEAVHRMRVSLRRMRTVIKAFRLAIPRSVTREIYRQMRCTATQLDDARDIDVYIATNRHIAPEDPLDSELLHLARVFRIAAYSRVERLTSGESYQAFKQDLAVWLESKAWRDGMSADVRSKLKAPSANFSREVLEQCRSRVYKYGCHLETLDHDGLHKLRIECKNLRYAAEFFNEEDHALFSVINQLKELQDVLGAIHDRVMFNEIQSRVLVGSVSPGLSEYADGLAKQRTGEIACLVKELPVYWEFFTAARFPWELT